MKVKNVIKELMKCDPEDNCFITIIQNGERMSCGMTKVRITGIGVDFYRNIDDIPTGDDRIYTEDSTDPLPEKEEKLEICKYKPCDYYRFWIKGNNLSDYEKCDKCIYGYKKKEEEKQEFCEDVKCQSQLYFELIKKNKKENIIKCSDCFSGYRKKEEEKPPLCEDVKCHQLAWFFSEDGIIECDRIIKCDKCTRGYRRKKEEKPDMCDDMKCRTYLYCLHSLPFRDIKKCDKCVFGYREKKEEEKPSLCRLCVSESVASYCEEMLSEVCDFNKCDKCIRGFYIRIIP